MLAVRRNGLDLALFPIGLRTPLVCEEAVKQNGLAIPYVPEAFRAELLPTAMRVSGGGALGAIPVIDRTPELCRLAVEEGGQGALEHVPTDLLGQVRAAVARENAFRATFDVGFWVLSIGAFLGAVLYWALSSGQPMAQLLTEPDMQPPDGITIVIGLAGITIALLRFILTYRWRGRQLVRADDAAALQNNPPAWRAVAQDPALLAQTPEEVVPKVLSAAAWALAWEPLSGILAGLIVNGLTVSLWLALNGCAHWGAETCTGTTLGLSLWLAAANVLWVLSWALMLISTYVAKKEELAALRAELLSAPDSRHPQ
ncbi:MULTISPECIES: DUF4116 domain-containing protein [unclassified Xanthobacter]|uniref:DUF4116 domain-containing protein n=1 Tax=unclassified Xanthobacter TaxID=2623496 RepID=UPI001F37AAFE|nr:MULTISPECIES: DUF4116 domain-containing protein [unclassified Xanthobacter]